MGCVSFSPSIFPTAASTRRDEGGGGRRAQRAAAAHGEIRRKHWQQAVGSSGTCARSPRSRERRRRRRRSRAKVSRSCARADQSRQRGTQEIAGLRPDRIPVIPGGLAILSAVFRARHPELETPAAGAMRQGLLYDLLGRVHHKDMRDVTVAQFMQRYHVDAAQARRVLRAALDLHALPPATDAKDVDENDPTYIGWAAKLRRDRYLGGLQRIPQAQRLHPRERRHARLLAHQRAQRA